MIGSGMVARSIPYREGFGAKQLAFLAHVGVMGAVVAPLTLLGGPLLVRAAWYTAGVVGGRLWVVVVLFSLILQSDLQGYLISCSHINPKPVCLVALSH